MGDLVLRRGEPEMSLDETIRLGAVLAKSGYFADAREEAQAVVKIMKGRALGIDAITALTEIIVIKGKISMSAGLIASLIRSSGKYDYQVRERANTNCRIEFFRSAESLGDINFSMEDARRAGLVQKDGMYEKYPANMLFARAMSTGARAYCPDIFCGAVYTPEELGAEINPETGQVLDVASYAPVKQTASSSKGNKPAPEGLCPSCHAPQGKPCLPSCKAPRVVDAVSVPAPVSLPPRRQTEGNSSAAAPATTADKVDSPRTVAYKALINSKDPEFPALSAAERDAYIVSLASHKAGTALKSLTEQDLLNATHEFGERFLGRAAWNEVCAGMWERPLDEFETLSVLSQMGMPAEGERLMFVTSEQWSAATDNLPAFIEQEEQKRAAIAGK